MLISDKHQFMFFHLYKTGGTSVTSMIKRFCNRSLEKHLNWVRFSKVDRLNLRENYFTFGFVRNPWDWQVSLYFYMLRDKGHFQHKMIKQMKDFDEYIRWRVEKEVRFQYCFFSEDGTIDTPIKVDFIGKLENFNQDMEIIKSKIKEKSNFEISYNVQHLNKTNHKNYREYYTEETKELVRKAFSKDIEYFNYEF